MDTIFKVLKVRREIGSERRLIMQGYFPDNLIKDRKFEAYLDKEKLNVAVKDLSGDYVIAKRLMKEKIIDTEYRVYIELTSGWENAKDIRLYCLEKGHRTEVYRQKVKEIACQSTEIAMNIDFAGSEEDRAGIRGWAVCASEPKIGAARSDGSKVDMKFYERFRLDLILEYPEVPEESIIGFDMVFPQYYEKDLLVLIKSGEHVFKKKCQVRFSKLDNMVSYVKRCPERAWQFYRKKGMKRTVGRVWDEFKHIERDGYDDWAREHSPSKEMLQEQRETVFPYAPKISIVIPLYRTPIQYLKELIESIECQTYHNWELCFSDGSGERTECRELVNKYQEYDPRIKMTISERTLQISENTNEALKLVTGEYVAFADHDDLLSPDALYEVVSMVNRYPDTELLYSDEDKITMDGSQLFCPHFKSDFNLDLLRTTNYICHLMVVKRDLLNRVGNLNPEFDGSQDFDFTLRCVEQTNHIRHIPKVLYHWRAHKDSTAENPESKEYAFAAGRHAVESHYERVGIDAEVEMTSFSAIYRSIYKIKEKPLVSIIIPNRDHVDDLKKCIQSIETKSLYPNLEYVIIENNSTDDAVFEYYKELESSDLRVKILVWDKEFNYSAINNYGVSHASGEFYWFLNNDTEIINNDCVEELLGYCMREDVGIVGSRLYYSDDTIQHAGVIIGIGGAAGHAFTGLEKEDPGYFARQMCAQNYSAVTAASMMVKRQAYEKVGGFNEELKVAFNDVDFCLKVREAGYLIVYNPYAELYHYESKSRGQDDTRERVRRFRKEVMQFRRLWKHYLDKGDPYYNRNLSLFSNKFHLD